MADITLTIEQATPAFKNIHQLLGPSKAILTNINGNYSPINGSCFMMIAISGI
jgi:hypothetical protein